MNGLELAMRDRSSSHQRRSHPSLAQTLGTKLVQGQQTTTHFLFEANSGGPHTREEHGGDCIIHVGWAGIAWTDATGAQTTAMGARNEGGDIEQ